MVAGIVRVRDESERHEVPKFRDAPRGGELTLLMVPPPAMPRLPRVARAALLAAFLASAAAAKKKAPRRGSACATLTPDGWREPATQ